MDNKGEKIRILLADSDEEFCAQMAALCEASEDMELVGIAENGDKALAAVGELRPELLITELSLPGMDGVMLLETLHRDCAVLHTDYRDDGIALEVIIHPEQWTRFERFVIAGEEG